MKATHGWRLRGMVRVACWLTFLGCLVFTQSLSAYPTKLGDIDGDNQPTVLDLAILINHINGTPRLSNEAAVFADINQDGVVSETDVDLLVDAILGYSTLPEFSFTRILDSSPPNGAAEVSVTRETILRFTQPLSTNVVITTANLYAEFGGQKLVSHVGLSSDHRTVTLFYNYPLPGSARIRVTFNGNPFNDFAGRPIDADGDGQPGGIATIEFDTLSQTPLTNTIVCGRVFDSLVVTNSGGTNVNVPLAGVTVTADGLEQDVRARTDANGNFRLTNAPPGHFFVHIDGRTMTNLANGIRYPDLAYYPYVGKEWESIPGAETNIGEVYLPLIISNTLQRVSATNPTVITFPTNLVAQHPELQDVSITVPPNGLYSDNGNRGGLVGLAPVPSDRLPGPLPTGLNFPLVITVQTDGPQNFDGPVPVCFPNLTNAVTGEPPLAPGAKSALWSFNHDTGQWEIRGSMTVSADGRLVCSDPGVGILAPGWHGTAPGSSGGGGPTNCPTCGTNQPPPCEKNSDPNSCPTCPTQQQQPPPQSSKSNPILLYSGEKYEPVTDLRIKGVGMDFAWTRFYGSRTESKTPQGNNWEFSYNICLLREGSSLRFCNGAGRGDTYRPFAGRTNVWMRYGFFQEIAFTNGLYSITTADQKRMAFLPFDGSAKAGKIASITDRNGNSLNFSYSDAGVLTNISDTLSRNIAVSYNADGFISAVTDFAGRSVHYDYYGLNEPGGSFGDLKAVTSPAVTGTPNGNDFPNGKTTTYTYSKGFADDRLNHNLLTITDARGSNYLVNVYSPTANPSDINFDRVIRQVRGGDIVDLTYITQTPSAQNGGAVIKVILNDRVGNVSEYFYDIGNRLVLLREYTGRANPTQPTTETANRPTNKLRATDPDFFETRYEYNADYLPTRTTFPNGNITENIYESDLNPLAPARTRGNLREVHRLPGTHTPVGDQSILVEKYEYDTSFGCNSCGFNFVTKYTDARTNVTVSQYDERGNLTNRIQAITSITEQFGWNSRGQMTNHILPDNRSGHRRVDAYTYYESGPQRGYLRQEIVDFGGFNLTTGFEYNSVGVLTRKTDARGHDTQYVVNQLDRVVREISPEVTDGSGIRYTKDFFYDANNNTVRVDAENRDENGVLQPNTYFTTLYDYEILNHVTRVAQERGAAALANNILSFEAVPVALRSEFVVTEYGYDGNRNRTLTRYGEATAGRQTNNIVQMLYDERDLPFREIRAPGSSDQSTTQFDYDGNKNRLRAWQGIEDTPRLTSHLFDSFNRSVSITDAMGNITTNRFDPNGNRVNTMILGELLDLPGSANNVRLSEITFTYDLLNRLTRKDEAFFNATNQAPIGDGLATTIVLFTDNSQVFAVINDNNHGTTNTFDTANRLRLVTDAKGNTVTYGYDEDSNISSQLEGEKSDLDGHIETFTTTFGHDNLNRLTSTTDNIGNLNRSGYDSRNNRTITIDALTNKVLYAFDGLSRLLQTTRLMTQDGTGATPIIGQIVTRQTWDDSSRLTSQIDDNTNATAYLYDGANRKFATVYADFTSETNLFDVHHNPIRFNDANGNIVTNLFDLLNRVTNKLVALGPDVAGTTTFERFAYDGISRLITASNDMTLITRAYDSIGHVTAEVQILTNATPVFVTSTYDGVGNLLDLRYPAGRVVSTLYDDLERKKIISDTNGTVAAYYYIGPKRAARRDYGNRTRCDYTYDGITGVPNPIDDFGVRHLLRTMHTNFITGGLIDDRMYAWDSLGNKTMNRDMRSTGPRPRYDYAYDSAYRLKVSVFSVPTGIVQTVGYNLDGVGNRVSVTGGTSAGLYAMDSSLPEPADRQLNQYTRTPSDARGYDKVGNLIAVSMQTSQAPAIKLVYDYGHRLVAYTNYGTAIRACYVYDAIGRRVAKMIAGVYEESVRYAHWGRREIETSSGANPTTFIYGAYLDDLLTMRYGSTNYYYHSDDLHNIVCISDANGLGVERYQYDDYGGVTILDSGGTALPMSAIANQHYFQGRLLDKESQLYFFRARYLDPANGRFLSRDPVGFWGDILGLGNPFSYAANNPARYLDPLGLMCLFPNEMPPWLEPGMPHPVEPENPCSIEKLKERREQEEQLRTQIDALQRQISEITDAMWSEIRLADELLKELNQLPPSDPGRKWRRDLYDQIMRKVLEMEESIRQLKRQMQDLLNQLNNLPNPCLT